MRYDLFSKFKTPNLLFLSKRVKSKVNFRIVEVSPRDGLQNESVILKTKDKVNFINRLSECGFKTIEATSFVSPKWVSQMADHKEVFSGIKKHLNVSYPVLVPNKIGLHDAESLERAKDVTKMALEAGLKVRGYISTVIGCPYEGNISPVTVVKIAEKLLKFGCYEISLGDTIGVGTVGTVKKLLNEILPTIPLKNLAVHFHDTYGQALSNVLYSIEKGICVADSSVAGLGGCPYAKSATGNLATEDLVYMLHGLGLNTGIDFNKVIDVSEWICIKMNRFNASKTAAAMIMRKKTLL